tara:strand:- start:93 stop:356 length:264 start_codon:yes stop_codon:yes gene_type:complete
MISRLDQDLPQGKRIIMVEPVERHPELEAFLEALNGISPKQAVQTGICAVCKEEANEFTDALSVTEYAISGLCQRCQDEIFDEPTEL